MTARLPFFQQVSGLLARHRSLVIAVIVIFVLGSIAEGVGIGLVIPLLEDPQGQSSFVQRIQVLEAFSRFFNAMTVVERVRFVAIFLVFVVLIQSSLRYLGNLLVLELQVRLERELAREAYAQLFRVAVHFVHRQAAGDLMSVLAVHTRLAATLVSNVVGAVASISILAVYTVLMLLLSWQLTFAAAGILVVLTIVNKKSSADRLKKAGEAQKKYLQKLRRAILESLSMIKLFHLYAQEKRMIKRLEDAQEHYLSHFYQGQKLIFRSVPLFNASAVLGLSLLMIAGTLLLPDQTEAWLARTVLFLIIVFRLMGPVAALNRAQAQVTNAYPSLAAVYEFLASEDKPFLKNGKIAFLKLEKGLCLEQVTFHYEPDEAPILKRVSFAIPKGQMTALVGSSGAGKSTIVNLIARLYDCDGGRITVDETNLQDLEIASWRSSIAVVSQDTLLLNDSVMGNLKFARQSATRAEVMQAARLAQMDHFVAALPQGYDTPIGDRGVRLSGGQQQRVAIARALLSNPDLLILDEATSNLDSETERAIQTAIDEFSLGRTVLVIAHRLSTIRQANNIVVIDGGQVIEQGIHEDLMKSGGLYRQLVETQYLERGDGA